MYRTSGSEAVRGAVDVYRMNKYRSEMSRSKIKEITKKVKLGIAMGIVAVGISTAAWFIEEPSNMVNKAMNDYNNDKLGQPVVANGK